MTKRETLQRPVDYWLKRADELLTEGIDKIQAVNGFSHTDWQMLNIIRAKGTSSLNEIAGTLQTFADRAIIENLLSDLLKKELIIQTDPTVFRLTSR